MMNSLNNSVSVGLSNSRPNSRGAFGGSRVGPAQAYQQALLGKLRPNTGIFSANITPALAIKRDKQQPTLVTYNPVRRGTKTPSKNYTPVNYGSSVSKSKEKNVTPFS